ncbi:MAG: heterocyst frequency control protein PatD [Merismopediaceae bacterium]|nr:heterocyst frequency control protein PatD [Merismopediaceae bacterium]
MLSTTPVFRQFDRVIQVLQNYLEQEDANLQQVRLQGDKLKEMFQQSLLKITEEQVPEAIAYEWRSLQVEMNRLVKLITTDLAFWQSARQAGSPPKQTARLLANLKKLQEFNQALKKLVQY